MTRRRNKHVVQICGGIGNQLFQYAFAYALMKETDSTVLLDPFYWKSELRNYELGSFNISMNQYMIPRIIDRCLGASENSGERRIRKVRRLFIRSSYNEVHEKEAMHYDDKIIWQDKPSYFIGYWQAEKYFSKYKDDIRREFILKYPFSKQCIDICELVRKDKCSVSLHVRRTDYLKVNGGIALDLAYYDKALRLIERQIGKANIYVFSDDKDFVKNNFSGRDYVLVEKMRDLEEFEIMRNCTHHIIANSTFSWWSAYLGDSPSGIVCAPETGDWKGDFYPKNWNLIGAETSSEI